MANIYKEKEVADYQNRFYSSEGNIGRQLLREAPQHERQAMALENQAQNLYSKGLEIEWQNTANELLADPQLASNPKALQEQLKKINDEMAGTIEDEEVKLDFLVNSELKGQRYIQASQANLIKRQNALAKKTNLNNIYSSINNLGLSIANGINGTANADTLLSALDDQKQIVKSLGATDSNGMPIFDEHQRMKMQSDIDKGILDTLKANIDSMDENQARFFYDRIKNDNLTVGEVNGQDINLKDVVDPKLYGDLKKYATDRRAKDLAIREKEQKIVAQTALFDFYDNPTQTNYDNAIKLNPKLSDDRTAQMLEILEATPNYQANTTFENKLEGERALKELAKAPVEEQEKAYLDYVAKLTRSNVRGSLSIDDMKNLQEKGRETVVDEEIRKIRLETSDIDRLTTNFMRSIRRKEKQRGDELTAKAKETVHNETARLLYDDYAREHEEAIQSRDKQKVDEVNAKYKKAFIELEYPVVKGKNIGDIVEINGIMYEYQGMSDTGIIVKVAR